MKNFFEFIRAAWSGGFRGKAGVLFALFAAFIFVRMFFGEANIPRFVINIWKLNSAETTLAAEKSKLELLQNHIQLIQNYSPDYIEELGLKYLNIGDPEMKILKV
ncbi:MAG: hypothetical protein LBR41_00625 [Rickettsiales bacterium]|jgi:hypothetical protein|nr:hypothetical protein [Rickettsiales bacterium]